MNRLMKFLRTLSLFLPNWAWFTLAYLVLHLPGLTTLPVFADEAIYIRWAQLFVDEPYRFAFFSMADGKPPLFIWLLSVFVQFWRDPLLGGRILSVIIGLFTMFAVSATARLLTGRSAVQNWARVFVLLMPFWWFYHRMTLMDGLLTLLLTLTVHFALKIAIFCQKERGFAYDMVPNVLLLGASFGGALMTKTPALFIIPVVALIPFFSLVRRHDTKKTKRNKLYESILLTGIGGVIGGIFFLMLRTSPLFGALFTRSGEFSFTIRELLSGEWRYVLFGSLPREIGWLSWYMTYPVIFFAFMGLWIRGVRKTVGFLLVASILFAGPLILFGRVLYPRYFLPIAPFITIACAIVVERISRIPKLSPLFSVGIVACILSASAFIIPSLFSVSNIPFTAIDRMQYLEEWSAGFGNSRVRDFIRTRHTELAGSKRIFVLTEGSFGTLPDGLLMYFWGKNQLEGVEIHGIGVGPSTIPTEYRDLAKTEEVYYVVNSHRFKLADPQNVEVVFEITRPNRAPSLILYRVL